MKTGILKSEVDGVALLQLIQNLDSLHISNVKLKFMKESGKRVPIDFFPESFYTQVSCTNVRFIKDNENA